MKKNFIISIIFGIILTFALVSAAVTYYASNTASINFASKFPFTIYSSIDNGTSWSINLSLDDTTQLEPTNILINVSNYAKVNISGVNLTFEFKDINSNNILCSVLSELRVYLAGINYSLQCINLDGSLLYYYPISVQAKTSIIYSLETTLTLNSTESNYTLNTYIRV